MLGYFGKTALPNGIVTGDEHSESDEDAEHEDAEVEHAAPALFSEDDHADGDHVENDPNDTFRILGVDAELNLWRLNLRGAFLIGNHDNPLGNGESVSYQGVMGNIIYSVKRNLLAAVRYDQVFSSDMSMLEKQFLTPYIHFLLLENVHLGAEYNINLDDTDQSNVNIMMDLAF